MGWMLSALCKSCRLPRFASFNHFTVGIYAYQQLSIFILSYISWVTISNPICYDRMTGRDVDEQTNGWEEQTKQTELYWYLTQRSIRFNCNPIKPNSMLHFTATDPALDTHSVALCMCTLVCIHNIKIRPRKSQPVVVCVQVIKFCLAPFMKAMVYYNVGQNPRHARPKNVVE